MKYQTVLFIGLLIVCTGLVAGCLEKDATSPVIRDSKTSASTGSLASLALTASDAPPGFILTESRPKSSEEVGELAKNLGWSDGYRVVFTGYKDDPYGETLITQTVATYPAERMPEIIAFIKESDRSDKELIISDLPCPNLGDESFAFMGKAVSQIILRPKDGSPLEGRTLSGSVKMDVVEVVFSKGPTLVVLTMTGPHADPVTLLSLSRKAEALTANIS